MVNMECRKDWNVQAHPLQIRARRLTKSRSAKVIGFVFEYVWNLFKRCGPRELKRTCTGHTIYALFKAL